MHPAVQARIDRLGRMLNDERPKSPIERLCYARQIRDLQAPEASGLVWDESEAVRATEFFKLLRHWKGRQFVGKPFIPEPWQEELVIAPLFGWRREDKFAKRLVRRFNEGYCEIPRKNGKSFLASGIASQGLIADGETGPEVYSAASRKEQAGIVFTDCRQTLSASPILAKLLKIRQHYIECTANNGILRAISSDYNMVQGRGPSRFIIDELHVHKTSETYDALIGGAGGRQDWLGFMITTAGADRSSICWDRHEHARKVLEGTVDDPTYWAFIAAGEPEDDIEDPETWWKANPNLGVSVFADFLQKQSRQAALLPVHENEFRRVHLNQWTNQVTRWLPIADWDRCQDEHWPANGHTVAALDCGQTRDPNAMAIMRRGDDGRYYVRMVYWMPADAIDSRGEIDRQTLVNWGKQGFIRMTEGNVADFDGQIPADIAELLREYHVTTLAYDSWGPAVGLIQRLQSMGSQCKFVEFRQSMANFAAPMREFERLVLSQGIAHDGDPVLRWMVGNVAVKMDAAGNIRPDKASSQDKIDGVVATLMGLGLHLLEPVVMPSIYEERGVLII